MRKSRGRRVKRSRGKVSKDGMAYKIARATTKPFTLSTIDTKYVTSLQNRKALYCVGDLDAASYGYAGYVAQFAFGLNPQHMNNGYVQYGTLPETVAVCGKRYHSLEIINHQTQDAYIKVYWLKARHDLYLNYTGHRDVNELMGITYNKETGAALASGMLQSILPATNIWDLNALLSWYKVVKVNKLKLQPGHSRKFTETKKKPIFLNGFYYGNSSIRCHGGQTVFPVIEVRGDIGHETGTTDALCATPCLGKTKIGILYEASYEFYQISAQKSLLKNQLVGLAAVVTPVSMQMSNPSNTTILA